MPEVIDCHALVHAVDTARYPLASDAAPIEQAERDSCTETGALGRALTAGAPSGAVLVQRMRFYGFDNRLVCDLAATDPRVRTLVSVDGRDPASAVEARRLLALPGVVGVRLMEPARGDPLDWLARDLWRAAAETGSLVDVHAFPWNRDAVLPALGFLMDEFADVRVVLDNLGNGPIEPGESDGGLDAALAPLIERPGLTFKFSDMTLGKLDRAGLDAAAAIARVAARVGPERLIWGSDVLPPHSPLADAAGRATAAVASLTDGERQAVLAGNARRLFGFGA